MDCNTPGFPVHHQLPELAQTHGHGVSDAIQQFRPVVAFSSCLQSFPASKYFPMIQFFKPDGQSIGASASASILPVNIQNWSPLGLTGLISLLSKGLSRVYSSTKFRSINFSVLSLLYGPILTSMYDYWENQSFDYMDLCWQKVLSLGVTKALQPNIATADSWISAPPNLAFF